MTPPEKYIRKLLMLPMGWRNALIVEEPGWWVTLERDGRICAKLVAHPTRDGVDYTDHHGWAYYPCDSLTWLRVTGHDWWAGPRTECGPDGIKTGIGFTLHAVVPAFEPVKMALDLMRKVPPLENITPWEGS